MGLGSLPVQPHLTQRLPWEHSNSADLAVFDCAGEAETRALVLAAVEAGKITNKAAQKMLWLMSVRRLNVRCFALFMSMLIRNLGDENCCQSDFSAPPPLPPPPRRRPSLKKRKR